MAAIHLIAGIDFCHGYLNVISNSHSLSTLGGSGTSGDPAYNLKEYILSTPQQPSLVITDRSIFYSQSKIYDYEIVVGRQRLSLAEYGITATDHGSHHCYYSGVRDLYTIIALADYPSEFMMTGLWFEGGDPRIPEPAGSLSSSGLQC